MVPAILHGENQPETLVGSHNVCDTHPTVVFTLGAYNKKKIVKMA